MPSPPAISLIFFILPLQSFFLTTPFFTTSLYLHKTVGTGFNLSAFSSAHLPISNLSTSDFKSVKSSFLANCDVSTPVEFFFNSDFVAELTSLIQISFYFYYDYMAENNSFLYNNIFFINPAIKH